MNVCNESDDSINYNYEGYEHYQRGRARTVRQDTPSTRHCAAIRLACSAITMIKVMRIIRVVRAIVAVKEVTMKSCYEWVIRRVTKNIGLKMGVIILQILGLLGLLGFI